MILDGGNDAGLWLILIGVFALFAGFWVVSVVLWNPARRQARDDIVRFPAASVGSVDLKYNTQANWGLLFILIGCLPGILGQFVVSRCVVAG